jgi:hypothetical protein
MTKGKAGMTKGKAGMTRGKQGDSEKMGINKRRIKVWAIFPQHWR